MWEKKLKLYDEIIALCSRFDRKGKTVPYTSANGYMFSILNKDGEIGIRFSKEVQKNYIDELKTTVFKSHGATMQGYVLIPDKVLKNKKKVAALLDESYDYVMTLPPK